MKNNLRALQLMQLEILKKVDEICKKHDIKYYLIGGTLLGAIRHQGFIPWDDDLDITMYRADYKRFLKIANKELGEEFFVQNFQSDNKYTRYITKIRVNGTKQVEKSIDHINSHHGIYIDIFPLDNTTRDKGLIMNFRGLIIRMLFGIKGIKAGIDNNESPFKSYMKIMLKYPLLLLPGKLVNFLFDYLCQYTNQRNGKFTTSFASGYGWRKQVVTNDVYGDGVLVEFEGGKYLAPSKWEVILKNLYNDYMSLPPKDKRVSGHNLTSIDLGKYWAQIEKKIQHELNSENTK